MKLTTALSLWLRDSLGGPLRYFKAVRAHPHVFFRPGVVIGRGCCFGRHVRIYGHATIANTSIGDHSYVGGGSRLRNCTVGKFCSLGQNVQIGLGIHPTNRVSTYPGFYSTKASGSTGFVDSTSIEESQPVTVGSDVWIGNNAVILDGVEIGHGAIVAAGAVVSSSVPPYAIVGGVPARTIRMRFEEDLVEFFLSNRWWEHDDAYLRQRAEYFVDPHAFRKSFGGKE